MNTHDFIPIIIGTDINAYNMAISFHEAYNIKPIIIGKGQLPITNFSSIIGKQHINSNLADPEQFATIVMQVAADYQSVNKKLLLVGTSDLYVRLIIENEEVLKERYVFNYMPEKLLNQLQHKSNFYELCDEYGIDIPVTYFYNCGGSEDLPEPENYPVIVKPSNGISYNKNKFIGQQKVYKVKSSEELQNIIHTISESGYQDELIIQDYIPGDDTYMWDSVIYVNSLKKTQLVTFAQVVLQEHTVTAIGNYTALITRYNEEMMMKLQKLLTAIDYVGFANFDLKYDVRDGKFKVFEVNIRQGRSSYYITALGHNMAEYIVDDVIYKKEKPLTLLDKDFLFTVVPKIVLRKFVENKDIRAEVNCLIKEGKYGNPLFYKNDHSIKRKLYLFARQLNYYRKYRNNKW